MDERLFTINLTKPQIGLVQALLLVSMRSVMDRDELEVLDRMDQLNFRYIIHNKLEDVLIEVGEEVS